MAFFASTRRASIYTVFAPFATRASHLSTSLSTRSTCLLHQLRVLPKPRLLPSDQLSSSIRLARRALHDFIPKPNGTDVQILPSTTNHAPVTKEPDTAAREQRRNDWRILKKLMVHVWPKQDWRTRGTVLLGFGLLISGKASSKLGIIGR